MKILSSTLFVVLILASNVAVNAADSISKQQAVEIATQKNPGRVLGVKRKGGVYQVKTLSDSGKLRVIQIDAGDGSIVSGHHRKQRPADRHQR